MEKKNPKMRLLADEHSPTHPRQCPEFFLLTALGPDRPSHFTVRPITYIPHFAFGTSILRAGDNFYCLCVPPTTTEGRKTIARSNKEETTTDAKRTR
jgi:hypothetical protein